MANKYQLTIDGAHLKNYFIALNREDILTLRRKSRFKKANIYYDEKNDIVLKIYSDYVLAEAVIKHYQYLVKNNLQQVFVKVYGLIEFEEMFVIVMEMSNELNSKDYLQSIPYDKQVFIIKKMISSIRKMNCKSFFHRDIAHYGNWFIRNDDILLIDFDSTRITKKYNFIKRIYYSYDELFSFCEALFIIFGKKQGSHFARMAVSQYTIFSFIAWPIINKLLIIWTKNVKYLVIED